MQTPASFPDTSARPRAALKKQATTWLVLALLSSLLCTSLCIGIGGAVFCYLAIQATDQGLISDAEAKLRWGKILTICGSVLGLAASGMALLLR